MNKIQGITRHIKPLFLVSVVIPTFVSFIYFGILASDVYISESRFVVRNTEKSTPSGLGALLKSSGASSASEEVYTTNSYIMSRDALRALNVHDAFAKAYSDPSISIFNRFNSFGDDGVVFERLYKYYSNKITVEQDTSGSITTLKVRAFTPKAAHDFNRKLMTQAEELVNRLNGRARQDLIGYATKELSEAKLVAEKSAIALGQYRNRQGIVDPVQQATVQLQMISKLQDELIATKTQLLQLRAFTPQNPQIPVLQTRISGLSSEINQQIGLVAGDQRSLAASAVEYQRLQLENQIAEKALAAAMASLQDARNEARRKKAYVEWLVEPNLPDYPLEPRRLRSIFATFAISLIAWAILTMLISGVREHND